MTTRIRYKETEEGLLQAGPFYAIDKVYSVTINKSQMRYSILTDSEYVAATGEGVTLALLKKKAKDSLKDLGVKFDNEIRQKKANKDAVAEAMAMTAEQTWNDHSQT